MVIRFLVSIHEKVGRVPMLIGILDCQERMGNKDLECKDVLFILLVSLCFFFLFATGA